jgi:hypothetical protein
VPIPSAFLMPASTFTEPSCGKNKKNKCGRCYRPPVLVSELSAHAFSFRQNHNALPTRTGTTQSANATKASSPLETSVSLNAVTTPSGATRPIDASARMALSLSLVSACVPLAVQFLFLELSIS